jgi:signal transduction histidine kinase
MVSHDLRNLLGGIVLCASSLSSQEAETAEAKKAVMSGRRIQVYAARMNRLICDLLDVVSIDAGMLPCVIVPSDPVALIAETLETFRRAAQEKGIELESEVVGVLPAAAFDYERMLQVFSNLVSNALKFTPRGGEICIRGEQTGDEIHFSVHDTGRGIRKDLIHSVFLRFWQAGTDSKGTGLGLYISKSLVEAHRGRIWVESKVGQGSLFHFTVPVVLGPHRP